MPEAFDDEPKFTHPPEIPANFPHPELASAVAGSHSKLAMVEFEGKYYLPGGTPPERLDAWQQCEAHARELVKLCQKNIDGKYAHMSQVEILEMYCLRLLDANSGFSAAEDRWKICRVAELLGWPVPPSAK